MNGRLLTLEEARQFINGRALYPGEDQWCAIQGRDWVQVGDKHHHPGKSHVKDCGGYPPWGDDPNNQTYGSPSWNYVALYQKLRSSSGLPAGLVVSTSPAATKLVELLLAKAPSILVPPTIVAACTPKTAATALKLLDAYPSAVLTAASVEPLLAKDGARLQKLLLDESREGGQSIQLVDALCAKSEVIGAAVAAPTMLHTALTPAAARLIVRYLDELGDDAFVAAATAIATDAVDKLQAELRERANDEVESAEEEELDEAAAEDVSDPAPSDRTGDKKKKKKAVKKLKVPAAAANATTSSNAGGGKVSHRPKAGKKKA